ncbi:hypothetical protein VcTj87_12090 [Vibrio comitans]
MPKKLKLYAMKVIPTKPEDKIIQIVEPNILSNPTQNPTTPRSLTSPGDITLSMYKIKEATNITRPPARNPRNE